MTEDIKKLEQANAGLKIRCFDLGEHVNMIQGQLEQTSNLVGTIATLVGMEITDGKLDVDELVEVITKLAE